MSDPWGSRPDGEPGPEERPGPAPDTGPDGEPQTAPEEEPGAGGPQPGGGHGQQVPGYGQPQPGGGYGQQAPGYGQPGPGGYPPPAYPSPGYPPPPGYGQPYGPQPGYGAAPPGYGPPAYSSTAYGYGSYAPTTSSKATTVMVLGIVSLVLFFTCFVGFITAIIALTMAGGAEREIAESGGTLTGETQIKAGRIMSWITLGLTALALLAIVGLIAIGVSSSP